jgi:hypothetical protein
MGRVMSDDFTRKRFEWLLQVAGDPAISGSASKLAIQIACRFMNRKTNTAWPSQPVLAQLLGFQTREGVRRCVDQLVDGGHLTVAVSHGRGTSNRYRLILKDVAAHDDPEETEPDDSIEEATSKNVESSTTEPLFPDDLPPAKAKAPRTSAIDEAFDIWWQQYPKKVARKAASNAYHRIVSKGEASSEELLTGVMRYSASQTGKDPKYVKGAEGWLNGGRWTDEPDPAPSGQFGAGASSRSQQQPRRSFIDIALEGLQRDEQE